MSFTGEFRHTIDAKGRLTVPSRMRLALPGDDVVITRWMEGCLAVWSPESFREMQTTLREKGHFDRAVREFSRLFNGSAHEDEIDKQGRITIPPHLRELGAITREAVIVGNDTHGEIWNPERWDAQVSAVDDDRFAELAQQLS